MQKNLLLVDGSSYLYRAFHALPDLRNERAEPTGAIYGMINMLRRLRQDYPADYLACVFDAPGKTFRDEIYPEYKATRSAMPEDLRAQIEPIHEVVKYLGWPVLCISGVEADDVIGTLCMAACANGIKTIVSTGDKDLAQLVNEDVMLVNTMTNETLDRQGVIEKFGVAPEQIIDYLTLIGDTVDNVPGVTKCGPKTAVKWLMQYNSLAEIISHASEISGVVGNNLRATLDWLPQGRTLITVKTDCDLGANFHSINQSLQAQPENEFALLNFYEKKGFKTWLRELRNQHKISENQSLKAEHPIGTWKNSELFTAPAKGQYECVTEAVQLEKWLAKIVAADLVCIDTETTSLIPMKAKLVGLSLCCDKNIAAYIPLAHDYPDSQKQLSRSSVLDKLRSWLENPNYKKVGQNLKYYSHVFANHGIQLRGIAHDTLLESYVLESHRSHDIDSLVARHLGLQTIKFEEVCGKGVHQIGFEKVTLERATEYAAEDADLTLRIHQVLSPRIVANPGLEYVYKNIELPVSRVLFEVERYGVLLDTAELRHQSQELGARLIDLEKEAYSLAKEEFNLNSPKQLGEIFFEKLGLPIIKKTPGGAPSTNEEVLQKLALDYPLPKCVLEYRSLSKLKSTYTDKLPKMVDQQTARVHTNYAQAVAVTGRLSSNEPNLQNIPIRSLEGRRVRRAFIAPVGCKIVSTDYSQIELRIMAHLSEDVGMLKAFAAGEDIHRATAAEIFGVEVDNVTSEQRRAAKVINFGLIYGMSAFGLAANLGLERSAAQVYINRYFQRFSGVAQYMNDIKARAHAHGYVETVFGRRLWLPDINAGGPRRQAAERAAINAPMQGTAADLIKLAMIAVQNWITSDALQARIIMQVHDELVLEVPNDELLIVRTKLPQLMAEVASLKVPLLAEVGVGENWDEAH